MTRKILEVKKAKKKQAVYSVFSWYVMTFSL